MDEKVIYVLIEHAKRCWDAERENAERLQNRLKLMSALTAVLLGVGLYKFEWLYDPRHVSRVGEGVSLLAIKVLLVAGLVLFAISFAVATRGRGRRKPHASYHLFLPSRIINDPPSNYAEAGRQVLARMHRASVSLLLRNRRSMARLQAATRIFSAGVIATGLSILVFIVASVPPIITDEGKRNDNATDPTPDRQEQSNPAPSGGSTRPSIPSSRPH